MPVKDAHFALEHSTCHADLNRGRRFANALSVWPGSASQGNLWSFVRHTCADVGWPMVPKCVFLFLSIKIKIKFIQNRFVILAPFSVRSQLQVFSLPHSQQRNNRTVGPFRGQKHGWDMHGSR